MIKIKEKGWFMGLGLHHAVLSCVYVIIFWLVGLVLVLPFLKFIAVICATHFFMGREYKEYELRNKGWYGMEWLDWISPLIIGLALAFIL